MNILLTGASSGIGYATALELVKSADNKVYAISRNKEKLEKLRQEYQQMNFSGKLEVLSGDLTSDVDRARMKSTILSSTNTLDILINNAGLLINKPFQNLSEGDWQAIYSTNVFSVAAIIRDMLPLLCESNLKSHGYRAHIVNIGSIGGLNGSSKFPGLSAYSSSKAALAVMTECLAEEFKELKVAVNSLALGSVHTEMFSKAFPGMTAARTAEEMAEYIADFAMKGNRYFNGKNLPVSGSTP